MGRTERIQNSKFGKLTYVSSTRQRAPVIALLCAASAAASLTFAEALERAALSNPDLAAERLSLPIAQAGAEAAGALANPTISGSVSGADPTLSAGGAIRFPIFGQRAAAVRAAAAEVPLAESELRGRALRLRATVRRSYFALAAAQAQTKLAHASKDLADRFAALAKTKYEAGGAPQLEVDQAALAAARADQDLLDREAIERVAQLALAAAIGAAPESSLSASDTLAVPAAPALDDLLAAVAQHPDVVSAQNDRAAAEARAVSERAAIRPTPELSLAYERSRSVPAQSVRGGVVFEVPLLSQNSGAVHRAEAQAARAEARAAALVRRFENDVRAAHNRWAAATRRAHFYADQFVPAATHVEELAQKSYTAGRAPLVSVLQAQSDVSQARARAVDAVAEAQSAFADLEEASGAER